MANSIRGWRAQNKDGSWTWWPRKPHLDKEGHWYMKQKPEDALSLALPTRLHCTDKVEDYTKSLKRYEGRMWK